MLFELEDGSTYVRTKSVSLVFLWLASFVYFVFRKKKHGFHPIISSRSRCYSSIKEMVERLYKPNADATMCLFYGKNVFKTIGCFVYIRFHGTCMLTLLYFPPVT